LHQPWARGMQSFRCWRVVLVLFTNCEVRGHLADLSEFFVHALLLLVTRKMHLCCTLLATKKRMSAFFDCLLLPMYSFRVKHLE
jgi:hypothetical protein